MDLDFNDYYEEFHGVKIWSYHLRHTKYGNFRPDNLPKEYIESLDRVELLRLIWWCDKLYERYPELKQYKDEGCEELI